MKQAVIRSIESCGIIAILRGYTKEQCLRIGEGLLLGGLNCMEITYPANGDPTETAEIIHALHSEFGGELSVGAGTVLTPRQVDMTYEAGGGYIISPNVDTDVITATVSKGLVSIPGALTPSECASAWKAGADFIKLFPMSHMGSDYLKTIAAPLSHIRFLAVGGVKSTQFLEYMKAGACGFGIGGALGYKEATASNDYSIITKCAKEHRAAIERARAALASE